MTFKESGLQISSRKTGVQQAEGRAGAKGGGRELGLRQGERWGDRGRVRKVTSDKVPGGAVW